MGILEGLGTLAIVGIILVVLVILLFILLRSYRIASPSQALIITGRAAKGADLDAGGRVVIGGRAVVYPIVQRAFIMSLSSRQIQVEIEGFSKNGIHLRLRGVAQVKVGGNIDDVRKAAQRFLDQQGQIDHYSQEILSGTLRAVVGTLTVEQIIQDRASFAAQVQAEAEHSMNNQGLVIDTFQISAVEDDGNYLRDWGRPQAAEVAKNAAIAEANAAQQAEKARAISQQSIAEAQQVLALRQAEIKEETDARVAVADAAGPLAKAAQQQKILEQEELIALRNADLREKQLVAEVRRPADAERYKVEQQAESSKFSRVAESEAELANQRNLAEARKVAAEAEAFTIERQGKAKAEIELTRRAKDAEAVRLEGESEAAALRARGDAEAFAINAKGTAEAEATLAKADAFRHFNDAAVLAQVLEVLPNLAGELTAPYANIKELSVVSTDGEAKIGQTISSNLAQVLQMVKGTTGVDILEMVSRAGNTSPDTAAGDGTTAASAAPSSTDGAPAPANAS